MNYTVFSFSLIYVMWLFSFCFIIVRSKHENTCPIFVTSINHHIIELKSGYLATDIYTSMNHSYIGLYYNCKGVRINLNGG